ncbi:MAG: uroporphyrinogen-III C-methyltransferase, partial [Anaerolineales bacterium]
LLKHTRQGCELIGRRAHVNGQDEINRLMIEKAREGKHVVRLKGGDPFLFGRGGEEAEALALADIPFEVVPGASAALAAPAYAGIPLTHRLLSSSVAIVTGHEADGKAESTVDWEQLSHAVDTLVVLMGVANLPSIVGRLLAAGTSASTPVALVHRGTLPQQTVLTSTLAEVVGQAQGIEPPAVLVVGEVAQPGRWKSWFEQKPLFGRRIVVAGEATRVDALGDLLCEEGAEVVALPVIETASNEDTVPLNRAIEALGGYDWLVFTSDKGVHFFWERLGTLGLDARQLGGVNVAAIGSATAGALAQEGISADLIPDRYCTEGLVEAFASLDLRGARMLLPRSDLANPLLPQRLVAMGAAVEEVVLYRTLPAQVAPDRQAEIAGVLRRGELDFVVFTSASSARRFAEIFPGLHETAIACLGPATAEAARHLGMSVQVVAEQHTTGGLVEAIVSHQGREA